ncbi:MAG: hypothetical protein LBF72_01310 [Holosporales bacterium]|nr:hypothetical protein [Holosporales bacterium]
MTSAFAIAFVLGFVQALFAQDGATSVNRRLPVKELRTVSKATTSLRKQTAWATQKKAAGATQKKADQGKSKKTAHGTAAATPAFLKTTQSQPSAIAKPVPAEALQDADEARSAKLEAIAAAIKATRQERQHLEATKQKLLSDFIKKETSFVVSLVKRGDFANKQTLLLALSAKSLNDLVHSSIISRYLQQYLIHNNFMFLNFVKSIREINCKIIDLIKKENNLIEQLNTLSDKKFANTGCL